MANEENSTEEHTGVGVFLIPASDDPIVAASSEPAHLTTVWLGDMNDLDVDTIGAIRDEIGAYVRTLEGPVVVPTAERGTLGDDGADVVFLERTDALLALREGLLEASPTVKRVMDSVEQFPDWTPHVTLGYPEAPALAEYDGDAVTFDRVGLWVGPDQEDFTMSGALTDQDAALLAAARQKVASFDVTGIDDDEMPVDELEDGEEEVTEIPVHGVATVEGRATGDGRGFRLNALDIGAMPQPLGYEYVSTHGGDTSNVAVVGRIDSYERKELEDGVAELRWRGVIMPGKEYGARAIESIIDGSYNGLSVIVDDVTLDVEEERKELRERLIAEEAREGDEEFDVDAMVDMMVGDGTQKTTWFTAARVRRFDMVPTGAFQEAYIGLGHEFEDEMTEEALVAAAAALEECGCLDGLSIVDLSVLTEEQLVEYDALPAGDQEAYAAEHGAILAAGFAPGTKDGPGWITHPIPTSRIRRYWVKGKGAAKIGWGTPGDFNRCRTQLAKYVQNPEWLAGLCANMHHEALGVWPAQHAGKRASSLTASATPLFAITAALEPIDGAFFERRELRNPRIGVVVEGDAIYGYVAQWNVCHVGAPEGPDTCTLAPHSPSNYGQYRTGTVMTTNGPVAVGQITMNTGHANGGAGLRAAVAHYDNTGAAVADVACGEDRFGIWFAGRMRPGATDEQRYALAASGRLSGDWRVIGGAYELVAALAVNVPGFPIPEVSLGLTASGLMSLTAAGVICPDEMQEDLHLEVLTASAVADIATAAAERVLHLQERQRIAASVAPARAAIAAQQLAAARAALTAMTKE